MTLSLMAVIRISQALFEKSSSSALQGLVLVYLNINCREMESWKDVFSNFVSWVLSFFFLFQKIVIIVKKIDYNFFYRKVGIRGKRKTILWWILLQWWFYTISFGYMSWGNMSISFPKSNYLPIWKARVSYASNVISLSLSGLVGMLLARVARKVFLTGMVRL